jgi:hypothetical protein
VRSVMRKIVVSARKICNVARSAALSDEALSELAMISYLIDSRSNAIMRARRALQQTQKKTHRRPHLLGAQS